MLIFDLYAIIFQPHMQSNSLIPPDNIILYEIWFNPCKVKLNQTLENLETCKTRKKFLIPV